MRTLKFILITGGVVIGIWLVLCSLCNHDVSGRHGDRSVVVRQTYHQGIGEDRPEPGSRSVEGHSPDGEGTPQSYVKVYTMTATAYSLSRNNTASGLRPGPGRVSVDPRVIPLGTKLYVEGYGPAVAADTGSAIKGLRIDVWLNSRELAIKWGRKKVRVWVLE